MQEKKNPPKMEIIFREIEREKNNFCVQENYVQNKIENCKFIVIGGELEKLKIKEDNGIQEK